MGETTAAVKPDFSLHITPRVLPQRPRSAPWGDPPQQLKVLEEADEGSAPDSVQSGAALRKESARMVRLRASEEGQRPALSLQASLQPYRRQNMGQLLPVFLQDMPWTTLLLLLSRQLQNNQVLIAMMSLMV